MLAMMMTMACLHELFDLTAAAASLIEFLCYSGAAFSDFFKRAPKSPAPPLFPLPQTVPRRKYHQRNWSCPRCAEWWQDTAPTATDTAGSAGEPAAKRAILRPNLRGNQ